jgi:hypothetical protein
LHRYFKQLPGDKTAQLLAQFPPPLVSLVAVNDKGKRINDLAV